MRFVATAFAAPLALVASLAAESNANACGACRGAGGAGGALTAADERWNVTLATLSRFEIGSWDWSGRAHAQPRDVTAMDHTAQLTAAVRVFRALEFAASGGGGFAWMRAPGLDTIAGGPTDLTLRARYDILAEDPARIGRPAMAVWNTVRIPTGNVLDQNAGSTAGQIGAFGLGAWELAWGADLRRTFASSWQPFVAIEAAWRAPDRVGASERHLGPRVGARTGLTYFATDVYAFSAMAEWGFEGDVMLAGSSIPGSWQERTSLGVAASAHLPSGLRVAVSLWSDVPIDGLGRNAEATVRLGLSIGYSRVEPAWRRCPVSAAPVTIARARSRHDG